MPTAKVTTPKALQINDKVGESFRVLYYGSASAGSVPFKWESQPGTPKHALTESCLPPLTPPPSYHHQFIKKYNSSMQEVITHSSSRRSGFFRTIFLNTSRKNSSPPVPASSLSSCSVSSSSSSSRLHSWQSTPMSKTEVRRAMSAVKFGWEVDGGSPASTLCFGDGFKKSYRIKKMKKAMLSVLRNGKA
ncbi:hypothetical protein R6Q57_027309 [Mikania cordata]